MALVDIYGVPLVRETALLASASFVTQALDATNDGAGAIFLAPKTGNIAYFFLNFTAKTGTAPTYRVGIETATTTRSPDGSILGGGTAKVDLVNPATGAAFRTLDTPLAVTAGDKLATTIRYETGTVSGAAFSTVAFAVGGLVGTGTPFGLTLTGGTWAVSNGGWPMMAVKYDDGTVSHGFCAATVINNTVWNSGSTPLYKGVAWTPDINCRTTGAIVSLRVTDATNYNLNLYEGTNGTPIATRAVDADVDLAVSNAVRQAFIALAPTNLTGGTAYRWAIEPTTVTNFTTYAYPTLSDAASLRAYFGPLVGTTATTAGTWTDANDAHPVIPVIDQWDSGGGGGGAVNPLNGLIVAR
jgi:hypothetical protein